MYTKTMGPIEKSIHAKLSKAFAPTHLEVENESYKHNVPEGSESHFKVLVVSELFNNQSRVQRQRSVYQLLEEEISGAVHALAQRLLTPEEWESSTDSKKFLSPDCKGGGK